MAVLPLPMNKQTLIKAAWIFGILVVGAAYGAKIPGVKQVAQKLPKTTVL